jgi:hypothetical protein
MAIDDFAAAAARVQDILGPESAIVGGLAVNAYGYVRATRDIDILVRLPLDHAQKLLEAHGVSVRRFRGNPLDGDFSCLKGVVPASPTRPDSEPVLVDVLPELAPLHPERLVSISLQGHALRVIDLETLIRLKLRAAGPKDLYDIAILASLNPAARQAALEHCAHKPRLLARVKSYLDDPRVAAEAAEMRRGEQMLAKAAKRRR